MNENRARRLALELMDKHGLRGWTFDFDRAVSTFGQCHYHIRKITLSRPIVVLNPQREMIDTMLHEIAHALAGHRAQSHGRKWRSIAKSLGCRAESCFDPSKIKMPPAPYEVKCCECGYTMKRYKKAKRTIKGWYCPCGTLNWSRVKRRKIA
jgi:predicted SprT family Zn-dependent metalloprotease